MRRRLPGTELFLKIKGEVVILLRNDMYRLRLFGVKWSENLESSHTCSLLIVLSLSWRLESVDSIGVVLSWTKACYFAPCSGNAS